MQSMKSLRMLASSAICLLPLACRSPAAEKDEVPCTCGQPQADIEGCAHESCLRGERNPDNPDCVCGSLKIPR
jgi:hypothetical protein